MFFEPIGSVTWCQKCGCLISVERVDKSFCDECQREKEEEET